jgi:hypothetical protein
VAVAAAPPPSRRDIQKLLLNFDDLEPFIETNEDEATNPPPPTTTDPLLTTYRKDHNDTLKTQTQQQQHPTTWRALPSVGTWMLLSTKLKTDTTGTKRSPSKHPLKKRSSASQATQSHGQRQRR